MKIALLVTGLEMGGAENQVVNLADQFAELGHRVSIIVLTGEAIVMPRNAEIKIELLRMRRDPISFLMCYRRARSILRNFSPDVVHSHMVHSNLFARFLRLTVPIRRLICTAHNINEGGPLRMWGYRMTDALADLTTNVSSQAVRSYIDRKAAPEERIVAVHNGIDCKKFNFSSSERTRLRQELGIEGATQVLLAIGRFTEQKDYPNLLSAFAKVQATHADTQLWIAGTGETQPVLMEMAHTLRISNHVRFLGLRRDVPALMSASDIFVLSSAWEGLPLVVGEAMACRRIVVSTDAGGIGEWLDNLGFIVPVRDSTALANGILAALKLPQEESARRGTAARDRIVEHFSLSAVVQRWLDIYQCAELNAGLRSAFLK